MKRGWYALMLVLSVLVGAWASLAIERFTFPASASSTASPSPTGLAAPTATPSGEPSAATPAVTPRPTPMVAVPIIYSDGTTVRDRFSPPAGYNRVSRAAGSFASYLVDLPLKPDGDPVLLYDGKEKDLRVYEAVIDMPIGTRNHQQAAGSVERLYAQYLYDNGRGDEITFHFTNGFAFDWKTYSSGKKLNVDGNKVTWASGGTKSDDEANFSKYLASLMMYNSIKALAQDTAETEGPLEGGVMLLQNEGSDKSHAVIVVDACENESGERLVILAQGFRPAQEMHILKNVTDSSISPWIKISMDDTTVRTPEFTFEKFKFVKFK